MVWGRRGPVSIGFAIASREIECVFDVVADEFKEQAVYVIAGIIVGIWRHDDGQVGKKDTWGLVMLDYIASTICYYLDVENGTLGHIEMRTRLPRRSHVFGISSAGKEHKHSSCQGGHGKPRDGNSKVEQALYDV